MKDLKEYTYNKDKQHYYQNSTKNAEVVKYSDGSICLYSYDTLIATIKPDGDIVLTPYWDYSRTTGQHLRQFLKDYGFGSYGSSKDIYNDLIKKRKVATDYLDIRRDAALENAIECIEFGSGDKDDCDWCGLSETDFNDVWKQAKQEVRNKRKNNNKKEVKEEMKDVKYTQRPEKLIKESKDDTTSLQVEYWEGGDDADLKSSHFEYDIKDVKDGIKLVKDLVDNQDFAKAELHKLDGVEGNYKGFKTLFGYDGAETWGDMESIKEGKADIYQDLEDDYFKALSKAEKDGAVYFFVDDEEFYTFEEAKKYAKMKGKDKITISAFGIEGEGGYDTGDYEEYGEVVVDLNKNIVDESCKKSMNENQSQDIMDAAKKKGYKVHSVTNGNCLNYGENDVMTKSLVGKNKKDLAKKVNALPDISKKSLKEECSGNDYWENEVQYQLENFDDSYAQELGLDKITDDQRQEMVEKIAADLIYDEYMWDVINTTIVQRIEEYCNRNDFGNFVESCEKKSIKESKKSTPKKNIRESVKKNSSKKQIKK